MIHVQGIRSELLSRDMSLPDLKMSLDYSERTSVPHWVERICLYPHLSARRPKIIDAYVDRVDEID